MRFAAGFRLAECVLRLAHVCPSDDERREGLALIALRVCLSDDER
jgi:hypothetical protein